MTLKDSPFVDNVRELLKTLDSEALLAMARTSSNNRILPLSYDGSISCVVYLFIACVSIYVFRAMWLIMNLI